jgi:hypothetical protein
MEAVTAIASVPAVVALVNLAKDLGLPHKLSPLVAVVIATVLLVANYYLAANGAYQAAVSGLILGLGASGLYEITKPVRKDS